MAKKEISKSQAIRNYLKTRPNAGPKEVIAALKKKNIEVAVGLVSNVKYSNKSKTKKTTTKATKPASNQAAAFDALLAVKKLTDEHGDENVRAALNVLKKL